MTMTAAQLERQALSWLRTKPDRPYCQHHWARGSGLTSPEHEAGLGTLLRSVMMASKRYPGFGVEHASDIADLYGFGRELLRHRPAFNYIGPTAAHSRSR